MVIRCSNGIVIDRAARTITVSGRTRYFRPTGPKSGPTKSYAERATYFFDAVCHLILNGETRKQDLFDFLFRHDANGGPEAGLAILDARICQWRPALAKLGLEIIYEKRGGIGWYKVKETST